MGVHFGEHITIDGYGGNPERLDSEEAVFSALTEMCNALHMRPLMKPVVVSAPDNHIRSGRVERFRPHRREPHQHPYISQTPVSFGRCVYLSERRRRRLCH